jgi:hypothetical protein
MPVVRVAAGNALEMYRFSDFRLQRRRHRRDILSDSLVITSLAISLRRIISRSGVRASRW